MAPFGEELADHSSGSHLNRHAAVYHKQVSQRGSGSNELLAYCSRGRFNGGAMKGCHERSNLVVGGAVVPDRGIFPLGRTGALELITAGSAAASSS